MSFGEPLFLLATLAALLPVIFHLMHRQRARLVPFSTLRFLKPSVQKTRRRKIIEDLLLLLARAAVFLLIAVALARPAIHAARSVLGQTAGISAVLVIDNSGSMAATDGTETRLERAVAAARQVLSLLSPGDEAAIVFPCGASDPAEGAFHTDPGVIYEALGRCRPFGSVLDTDRLINVIADLLKQAHHEAREVYIFTDLQAASWEEMPELHPVADEADLYFVDVAQTVPPNAAVRSLDLLSPGPLKSLPCTAVVEVANTSSAQQERHVELYLNDKRLASSPTLLLAPRQTTSATLVFRPAHAGQHSGRVVLAGEDSLALDDVRYFVWAVAAQIRVLLVAERTDVEDYSHDAFYVAQLLSLDEPDRWPVQWKVITPEALATEPLAGYELVCIVGARPLANSETASRIADYVSAGGQLLLFPSNRDAIEDWKQVAAAAPELLPGRPVRFRSASIENVPGGWSLTWIDVEAPLFRPLQLEDEALAGVQFYRYLECEAADAAALLRLSNGAPLLLTSNRQHGLVMLFCAVPHVDWGTMPVHPLFVPVFSRLIFSAAERSTWQYGQFLVGQPVQLRPQVPGTLQEANLRHPNGEIERVALRNGPLGPVLELEGVYEPGVYTLLDPRSQQPVGAFAVNVDANESDLATVEPARMEEWAERAGAAFVEDPTKLPVIVQQRRRGSELWAPLLIIVLLLMVFEAIHANWRSRHAGLQQEPSSSHAGVATIAPRSEEATGESIRTPRQRSTTFVAR